jgi:hypothetical protein
MPLAIDQDSELIPLGSAMQPHREGPRADPEALRKLRCRHQPVADVVANMTQMGLE